MKNQQKNHSEEFRRETVRLLESSGKSVPELAGDLGVSAKSLYRWRKQYGTLAKPSTDQPTAEVAALEAELKQLRRDNEILRQQRDILKKALGIVSQSQ